MANPLYDHLFGPHVGKPTAFLYLENGKTLTHDDFLSMTAQFAHVIRDCGLKTGDCVAVQIDKSAQALAVYGACVQAGMVFLPLNTAYTPDEVSYFLQDSGARLFLCSGVNETGLASVASTAGARLETLNANGSGSFAAMANGKPNSFATVDRKPGDLVALLYTSGTTGRSKGAMLSQENLLSNAQALVDIWAFSAKDTLLHPLPIFHTHGLFVATNVMLLAGGAMLFMTKFDVDFIINNIARATTMMGVPTFYTRLLGDDRFTPALTKHMRLFISGSAPLLADTHVQFEQRTGHRILERYGMTETSMNTSNPYVGERRAGTVGFPLPGVEIKITDTDTSGTLPDGDIGQIEIRGPNVFIGYWQMPEKTKEELRSDGFFITGDLGRIDEAGYLHIVGRNKDLVISGGYNIYPKEVELLIDEQPNVSESAVIGVPHPDLGEAVVAVIVAKAGTTINLEGIGQNLGKSLARFKQPKKLLIVSELPRNTMGKVQKNLLRDTYESEFA